MHLMCGDLNIDHSKTNEKFLTLENVLGEYDLLAICLSKRIRQGDH